MAALLFAESLAGYAIGENEKQAVLNTSAGAIQGGGFLVFLIGACVAAPVMEEFIIRGFMWAAGRSRSLARSEQSC